MTMLRRLFFSFSVIVCTVAPAADPEDQAGADVRDDGVSLTEVDGVPLDGAEGRPLSITRFRPQSQLVVPVTNLKSAAFPVVDAHTHFHYRFKDNEQMLDDFVALMDRNRIAVCVSLDGRLGEQLRAHQRFLWQKYRDRFVIFANVDWVGDGSLDDPASWACHRPGFADRTAEQLADAAWDGGISGLKLFKRFGLGYRNPDGSLMEIDDPRWDPIWAACGRLGLPIIIHTADPKAFFGPIDATNERWEELSRHPDWSFHGDEFPSRASLLEARNRVIERHPETTFIGAHVANNSEDLSVVADWLERYPNLVVEIASRINELGRQPYSTRDFLIKYQDRVLFGTDGPWAEDRLRLYWRFLETRDQYMPYAETVPPPQGLWQVFGVKLPPKVLRKIYSRNAARVIPGVAERLKSSKLKAKSTNG